MSYEKLLTYLANKDERIVVMTAENRATIRNIPKELVDRFIDTGITEQTLIGTAAGLALRGRIPVVHALASFLTMRAFEFIRTDIGISHLPVKLVGFVPGLLSTANGPTHQAIEDIALMRSIPGMRIFTPSDRNDLLQGLKTIIEDPHPWYIRYNDIETEYLHPSFEIGECEYVSIGYDVAIFTYGLMFHEAIKMAKILREEGKKVELVNMRCLEPYDVFAIIEAARKAKAIVTIEDHFRRGGLYSIVAETLIGENITLPVLPISLENRWFRPGLLDEIKQIEGLTAELMSRRILNFLNSAHVKNQSKKLYSE